LALNPDGYLKKGRKCKARLWKVISVQREAVNRNGRYKTAFRGMLEIFILDIFNY
jgi:hypothetical protein